MSRRLLLPVVALGLLAACGESTPAPTTPTALTPGSADRVLTQANGVVVMSDLANPRGLAWGPDGALYVAEAGRGGTGPCFIVLGSTVCYGATGAISRLRDGVQERVVSDLPSWVTRFNANGSPNNSGRGQGPNGIAFHGGVAYVSIGLEADPALRTTEDLTGLGQLVRVSPSALVGNGAHGHGHAHAWEYVADVAGYEALMNPDCGELDSNPFGVAADESGVYVADAGGNFIMHRAPNGDLSTAAVFSNNTTVAGPGCPVNTGRDFVPTSITRGPDGAYYIGHLNAIPILPGSSSVWRLEPGGVPTVYCAGFTWIVGLSFDQHGTLYVLQHADGITQNIPNPNTNSPGTLHRVSPTCVNETVAKGLTRPTGVLADTLGNVYVSLVTGPNFASEGQVRRFTP